MAFFLKFMLISYAAVAFFAIGFRLAVSRFDLSLLKLALIFVVLAIALSLSFRGEVFENRLIISVVWTSLLYSGFRFGKKVIIKDKS